LSRDFILCILNIVGASFSGCAAPSGSVHYKITSDYVAL